jgi:hypothetical protein
MVINPFRKKYYYLAYRKADGTPAMYGPLRKQDGSYCRNDKEANHVALMLSKGRLFELRESKHSTLQTAIGEFKANKFELSGDLDGALQRVSHKLPENTNEYEL